MCAGARLAGCQRLKSVLFDLDGTLTDPREGITRSIAYALVYAERIVRHFALDAHFAAIHGCELDGTREDKRDLLAHLLPHHGVAPGEAAMIGDRGADMVAARHHGLRAIGALWGYDARRARRRRSPILLRATGGAGDRGVARVELGRPGLFFGNVEFLIHWIRVRDVNVDGLAPTLIQWIRNSTFPKNKPGLPSS